MTVLLRRVGKGRALLAAALAALLCAQPPARGDDSSPAVATVTINEGTTVKPFNPELFGIAYDWSGEESVLRLPGGAADPQAAALFDGFPLSLNRMAGTDSQEIRWKGAIGPLEGRSLQKLWHWTPEKRVVDGPVEWVSWVQARGPGAKFSYNVNLLRDTPQEIAELVQFLTGSEATPWGKRRKELGLSGPVPVVVWEIGNEMDLKIDLKDYVWTADQYVAAARPVIEAIKAADPNAKIALQGSSNFDDAWNRTVLRELGARADYLTLHCYYRSLYPTPEAEGFMGHPEWSLDNWIAQACRTIRDTTGGDHVKLYISEHARWPKRPDDKTEDWRKSWYKTHSLEGCLATASFLVRCLNRPEVEMAAYHNFSSGPWGLFYRDAASGKLYTTGIYDLFRLFGTVAGDRVAACSVTPDGGGLRVAAVAGAGGITLVAVNPGEAVHLRLAGGGRYAAGERRIFTASSLDDYDTADRRPIAVMAEAGDGKPCSEFSLPARSVVVLKLARLP